MPISRDPAREVRAVGRRAEAVAAVHHVGAHDRERRRGAQGAGEHPDVAHMPDEVAVHEREQREQSYPRIVGEHVVRCTPADHRDAAVGVLDEGLDERLVADVPSAGGGEEHVVRLLRLGRGRHASAGQQHAIGGGEERRGAQRSRHPLPQLSEERGHAPPPEPSCGTAMGRASRRCSTHLMVGVTGFEPATSSSRTTRATKLRHTPVALAGLHKDSR